MRTVHSWTCELGYGADTMFHRTYFLLLNRTTAILYTGKSMNELLITCDDSENHKRYSNDLSTVNIQTYSPEAATQLETTEYHLPSFTAILCWYEASCATDRTTGQTDRQTDRLCQWPDSVVSIRCVATCRPDTELQGLEHEQPAASVHRPLHTTTASTDQLLHTGRMIDRPATTHWPNDWQATTHWPNDWQTSYYTLADWLIDWLIELRF